MLETIVPLRDPVSASDGKETSIKLKGDFMGFA
jgi:hypothetical protein